MGLSGRIGAAAASGLEELLTRQLLEAQHAESLRAKRVSEDMQAQQFGLQKQRLEAEQAHQAAMDEQAGIDALREGQDRTTARLSRVQGEQDQMDKQSEIDQILSALDPRQKTVVKLGGKLSMDDMQTPEERKAKTDAEVERAKRIAEAQYGAAAKFREPKEPKPTGPAGLSPGQLTTAKQFQDDYARDSKNYVTVRNAYQQVKGAAKAPDAAGDLSLIFGYMKMLDPNSVVRETEFANAQNAAGIPDQIRNAWNRALSGERLNPKQRQQFVGQAERIWQSAHGNQSRVRKTYGDRATKFGIDPTMVLDDEEPLSDPIEKEQVNTRTGERRIVVSTDGGKTWQPK